jgi:hypothetical protein
MPKAREGMVTKLVDTGYGAARLDFDPQPLIWDNDNERGLTATLFQPADEAMAAQSVYLGNLAGIRALHQALGEMLALRDKAWAQAQETRDQLNNE